MDKMKLRDQNLADNNGQFVELLSCRIFVQFATKLDPVSDFIKLGSARLLEHFATNPDPVTDFIELRSTLPSKAPLWCQN